MRWMVLVMLGASAAYAEPVAIREGGCIVELPPRCPLASMVTARVVGNTIEVRVELTNHGDERTVDIEVKCQRPFYVRPTQASAIPPCKGTRRTKRYKLAEDSTLVLGRQRLPAAMFPPGSTMLVADVSASGTKICSPTPVHIVRDVATKRLRIAAPAASPEARPPRRRRA